MSSNSSSSSVSGVKGEPQQVAAAASSSSSVRSTPPPPPQSTTPLISSTTPTPSGSSGQATAMAKKPRYDSPKQQLTTNGNSSGAATTTAAAVSQPRPLVALLDGRDCSVEMPILKEIATVAFCDAQSTSEIHEKVLNEAQAALLYSTIALSREDLLKFRALKLIVKIGVDLDNVDVKAAADLNIAVCNVSACCVEETADSTMSLILSLYRRTHWLASQVEQKLTSKVNGSANSHQATSSGNANHHQSPFIVASTPEQSREVAHGSTRIRGQNLGLVGLDKVALAVAMRARVFGFNVAFYDPNAEEGVDRALGGLTRCNSLAELIKQSDCVSLHSSLTDSTYHMINESSLKHVKSSIFLVNTSHHSLVDDVALAIAIKAGTVRAAALDKFAPDSIVVRECSHALVLTPGVAFYSDASMKEMREQAAHEVRRGLLAVAKAPSNLPAANLIGLIGSLKNCVNKDVLISSVASSSTSSASSSASLLGFSNGSSSSHHHPATAALMMQLNNSNDNRSNASSINRNMSSGQLSAMGGGATASSTSGVSSVSNNSSSVLSQGAGGRGAGAGSPLINPLMAAAMAASNNLSNPLAAASNLLASPNNAQLLAQLSYFKSAAAAGSGGPSSASGFDQLSAAAAAAAALNGVPASSITPALLSYLSPLAAAAAATSSSTSSPSPSPNNPSAAALNPSGPPQGGGLGSSIAPSQLAALNALISNDPMLQKQAALAAAAQQQQQQQAAMAALLGGVAAVAAAGDGNLKMDSSSPGAENGNSAN